MLSRFRRRLKSRLGWRILPVKRLLRSRVESKLFTDRIVGDIDIAAEDPAADSTVVEKVL